MASGVMTEAILIIASIVVATSIAGVVMSKVGSFESTFTATSEGQKDTMLTKLKVIYAANTTNTLNIWTKNIGINPITSPTSMDVYFGQIGSAQLIPYSASGGTNTWKFSSLPRMINQTNTFQIQITDNTLVKNQNYMVRITAPNGVYDDYVFSLS